MASVWDAVVGQEHAVDLLRHLVDQPVHGFLLVGPEGCGKEEAARAYAARLISGADAADSREARLIFSESHPDVHEFKREGASISKDDAEDVIALSSLSTNEASHLVVVLHDVHLMGESQFVRLLKTLEEPPNHVRFLLLAESITPDMATIASRCAVIHLADIDPALIEDTLLREGVPSDRAHAAALGAMGSLSRARLLASDADYLERREAFARLPFELDGTGHRVASLVDDIKARIDAAAAPLQDVFAREIEDLQLRIKVSGERGSGKKELEASQKRRLRRHLTEELRNGLAVTAAVYRNAMSHAHNAHRIAEFSAAIDDIHRALGRLALNANEDLLLQDLFLRMPLVREADFVG